VTIYGPLRIALIFAVFRAKCGSLRGINICSVTSIAHSSDGLSQRAHPMASVASPRPARDQPTASPRPDFRKSEKLWRKLYNQNKYDLAVIFVCLVCKGVKHRLSKRISTASRCVSFTSQSRPILSPYRYNGIIRLPVPHTDHCLCIGPPNLAIPILIYKHIDCTRLCCVQLREIELRGH